MMQWRARAPVRFCDLGGWTDTRIVPHGAVLNFTARMYTYVTLTIQEGPSARDPGEPGHRGTVLVPRHAPGGIQRRARPA